MQDKIGQIQDKIELLIAKLDMANEKIAELTDENVLLKNKAVSQNEDLKSFQNREKISKIVEGVAGHGEKGAQLKHKINEYIKEIDKCIAYLS